MHAEKNFISLLKTQKLPTKFTPLCLSCCLITDVIKYMKLIICVPKISNSLPVSPDVKQCNF